MAQKIEIVTQKILIPHCRVNGQQTYKDYGFQKVWIYDVNNDPPTILKAGWMPSGRFEIEAGHGGGVAAYSPYQDGGQTTGELEPKVKHIPYRTDDEATGVIDH